MEAHNLSESYIWIDKQYQIINEFVGQWHSYQALWDVDYLHVCVKIGSDLGLWEDLFNKLQKEKSNFDTSTTMKVFPGVTIEYSAVQSKVTFKYGSWQKQLLLKFGSAFGELVKYLFSCVHSSRIEMEKGLLTGSTDDVVNFIFLLQELKLTYARSAHSLIGIEKGQKALERFRYQYPSDWISIDQLLGEWSAFCEIFMRKSLLVDRKTESLRITIAKEYQQIFDDAKMFLEVWKTEKPIQGHLQPSKAVNSLNEFEIKLCLLIKRQDNVFKAVKVLNMPQSVSNNQLNNLNEELQDLQVVWISLQVVSSSLKDIDDVKWISDASWTIKDRLEALQSDMKAMPNKSKQYAGFETIQRRIHLMSSSYDSVFCLKSDALRDRHWEKLLSGLRIQKEHLTNLTVGKLWNAVRLNENSRLIQDVLTAASGELALEDYLTQIRNFWAIYELQFLAYQKKCRLVRGSDEILSKLSEHLASLTAMKNSPHYKSFKFEATVIEENLTSLKLFLESWLEVQTHYVHLEGIFTGNQEIKQILPTESDRFLSLDAEFISLLQKIYKSPLAMDVILIPNIQKGISRLSTLLEMIQKSLGEFLENERAGFPRFYFLGDQDLLEILGNTRRLDTIVPHLKKMFGAIDGVYTSPDKLLITAIISKEGEAVYLKTPVDISSRFRVMEWLSMLEIESKSSLRAYLAEAVIGIELYNNDTTNSKTIDWLDQFPAQIIVLAAQCQWTQQMESMIIRRGLDSFLDAIDLRLQTLTISPEHDIIRRKKCEFLITELVYQRAVCRALIVGEVVDKDDYKWTSNIRFYLDPRIKSSKNCLSVDVANASFYYNFEYLGIYDKLVQTPLTDRCYMTLCQALNNRLGGSPFGPAGTGKTESVKALACQLGVLCFVFCCDKTFDFKSIGRILMGLSQVGAWICFDEFNRLDEKILSAVSQQIQAIQTGLKSSNEIVLLGKAITVNKDTGIFITMNPGYAGRSELPDNLKKLFRSVSMAVPDRMLIAQVFLYTQGFKHAEHLASKVIPFFEICFQRLSSQAHYDFGLRALKSVLASSGITQRRLQSEGKTSFDLASEEIILVDCIRSIVFPKLLIDDEALANSLLLNIFPHAGEGGLAPLELEAQLLLSCKKRRWVAGKKWISKTMQIYSVQMICHGIIIVGSSASGKSTAIKILFDALSVLDGNEGQIHKINPKSVVKRDLYGWIDPTTREWTDGIFTKLLRKIIADVLFFRHWIVFDGTTSD